ncbi:membrane protein insertase YidC [Gordonia sp. zg691]|uniref:Membrane protein insertase YidC n=1 Tax=Gordonia jinghuaiqii TaxID=2758710 RepID=A0A7D7R2J4_9ACTN|nr:membrane protein insertase YidC [Gordonia jinghuaiqii]MBD0862840.1 membrane protein insertase YidC [Gordonia jinghuaiqii]MCR5979028.1 membrane protein insertase YidC [Gordonia jinghuaiqii]QMT01647.1 membrane protein insertase YidC [Gordonia jinghuaiqii]
MLDFIYYPVSGIMWVWHWLFSHVTPDTPGGNGIAWALSVVFLVFTLRAILYKPFVKQIRTTKKMQEINPQLQAIRKKYAKDRVKMTEEMQKLQKEHGFNPMLGCLPMLLQIPVFIGLFHVLRSFNRMGTGMGQLGMSAAETRSQGNYVFSAEQVQNFLDARLFGVPLSSYLVEPATEFQAFVEPGSPIDFTRPQIAFVVVPMMIVASIATHMNSRASVARQPEAALENPQTRMMNNLALYIFPVGILVTGPFFPVAILLYWMSNNIWTYGQQHIVFGHIAKEEEEAKLLKQEKLKANAPKPGVRPDRKKRGAPAVQSPESEVKGVSTAKGVSMTKADKSDPAATTDGASDAPADAESTTASAAAESGPGTKPKAGQKPTRPAPGPGTKKQNHNRGGQSSTAKRGNKRGGKR